MHIPSPPTGKSWQELCDSIGGRLREIVQDETQTAQEIQAKETEIAGDLVTAADVRAQAVLEELLFAMLPGSSFLGEEDYNASDVLDEGFVWIVDPLDGTLNFACNLPFFGASVALVFFGHPVLGVVYDAAADTLFDAVFDGPARRDGNIISWDAERAARAPIGISSGFLALMRGMPDRYAPPWIGERFRIFGSQAIQLCWAAEGRLRLNINYEAKLWDDAAGALICQRAGAGHEALNAAPFFPLLPAGDALAGKSLFSVSGSPELVVQCATDFASER